ncbi:MAG: hypothetical protein JWM80_4287 [Cyanobacteria bacterium RYN_339]|nr:hypothetical protein [Cyanobacteria bacterium RYN_339]
MKPSLGLLLALALVACQPTLPVPQVRASAKPQAAASATPGVPAADTHPPSLLARPVGDVQVLAGQLQVDATYVAANAGGRIISNDGASIISTNGSGIISNDGASIISTNGSGIISTNGSGAVGPGDVLFAKGGRVYAGGGNVVAEGPLAVRGQSGLGIISTNGSGIISTNGSGIISTNGSGYRLAAAPAPAPGRMLPAAGMRVGVMDLDTQALVPLGQDAAGRPVTAIYTDLAGRYQLYLPAGRKHNVVVVANVPDTRDLRQLYAGVSAAGATALDVDEDSSRATELLRATLVGRLYQIVSARTAEAAIAGISPSALPAGGSAIIATLQTFWRQAQAAGITADRPVCERQDFAQRSADRLLAHVDLASLISSQAYDKDFADPPEPAIKAITEVFGMMRAAGALLLAADPHHFEAGAYLEVTVPHDPVRRPTDVATFAEQAYLYETHVGTYPQMLNLISDLARYDADGQIFHNEPQRVARRLEAAGFSILFQLILSWASEIADNSFELPKPACQ